MDNLCKECGAEIMRPKKNGPKPKYCSARCREILNYKKQRGKLAKTIKYCLECGKEIPQGNKKKFCASKCQDINLRRRKFGVRQCEQCGKDYIPKRETSRFCSEPCTLDYGRYVLQGCEKAEEIPCPVCGKLFRATMDRGRQKQFCSKKCFVAVQPLLQSFERICVTCGTKYLTAEGYNSEYCSKGCKKAAYTLTCTICGKEYEAQNRNQAACSEECRKEKDRLCSIESYCKKDRHKNKTVTGKCKECGKQFKNEYGEKRKSFCSDKCGRKHGGRIGKAARRARIRGGKCDIIDPYEIFRRAGWKCELCGVKTPLRLRGTIDDKAPELDHIIPIGGGYNGTHTWDNVQCLCRKCNREKGATVMGQMRMFV